MEQEAVAVEVKEKPIPPRMIYFVAVLTVAMCTSFLISLVLLYFFEVPPTNKEVLVYMLGQLSGLTSSCVLYWVATTHASGQKTELLAKAQPIKE